MGTAREAALARLSGALSQLAEEDLPGVLAEAREGARAKARGLLEEAFVDALLARAAAPRPSPGSGDGWWVYGVIPADDADRVRAGLAGVEPGSEVETVVVGELAGLASRVPLSEYDDERIREHLEDLRWVERTARAHEAVLEAALATATVVPLRLCTIYRDRSGVEGLLSADAEHLTEAVERLRGRSEWGLKVFADRARLADVARGRAGAAAGDGSEATEYLARKRRDRELRDEIQGLAEACADEAHARLAGAAAGARVNPLQRPEAHGHEGEMVLNGVYLVEAEAGDELAAVAADLRAEYGPLGFELELTGPWPAYNFVAPAAPAA
jgi:hypothetical protein